MQQRILAALHRRDGARILAGLVRRFRDVQAAEDALQEAYARALRTWPAEGIPENPAAWITTVAVRVQLDRLRQLAREQPPGGQPFGLPEVAPGAGRTGHDLHAGGTAAGSPDEDLLGFIFMCCHPALAPSAQMALALRCLCGLDTAEIARAFVEPEATTAQKLVRARRKIREAAIPFGVPTPGERAGRLGTVLGVVYLLFNEGFSGTRHGRLGRPDLVEEALRLAHLLADLLPQEPEVLGLLALVLLHSARMPAREDAEGTLIPLEVQDRCLWLPDRIAEGRARLAHAMSLRKRGPYQIQAAIAALHAGADSPAATDWPQIHALYGALLEFQDTPVVRLNALVARGFAGDLDGAVRGLDALSRSGALKGYHLLPAAQADLARRQGRLLEARVHYAEAVALARNEGERRFLIQRLASLKSG